MNNAYKFLQAVKYTHSSCGLTQRKYLLIAGEQLTTRQRMSAGTVKIKQGLLIIIYNITTNIRFIETILQLQNLYTVSGEAFTVAEY